jgi:transposase-like protein
MGDRELHHFATDPPCAAMRPIYTVPTVEVAELALERFAQSWGDHYPMSVASWRADHPRRPPALPARRVPSDR